jgi:hypothetical protein
MEPLEELKIVKERETALFDRLVLAESTLFKILLDGVELSHEKITNQRDYWRTLVKEYFEGTKYNGS